MASQAEKGPGQEPGGGWAREAGLGASAELAPRGQSPFLAGGKEARGGQVAVAVLERIQGEARRRRGVLRGGRQIHHLGNPQEAEKRRRCQDRVQVGVGESWPSLWTPHPWSHPST